MPKRPLCRGMSHGVADSVWEPLEKKGNKLQHARHEKGPYVGPKPL